MKGCEWYLLYIRARININVRLVPLHRRASKISFSACFENQLLTVELQKSMRKSASRIWSICCKAVLLHPLSREKRGTVDMLERNEVLNLPLQETFFENFF